MVVRRHARREDKSELEELVDGDNDGMSVRRVTSFDSSVGANSATASLNLDHLTNRKIQVSTASANKGKFNKTYYGRTMSWTEHCCSHLSMLCYFYPRTCGSLVVMILLSVMLVLASLMLNPIQEYGTIAHDHSNIHSVYDLSMGNIDHWCLGGGNKHCQCEDPLTPISRVEHKSWIEAFKTNRKLLKRFEDPVENAGLDVAFLGESIIEEIDGRWMGRRDRSTGLKNLERIFNQHFHKASGATVEGVALGIAGDTAPNVLWRLMHGEMPDHFTPKVWWLSLGNNDLGRMECSEEVVVIGILRIVEEILEHRPDARVVINSIFPMIAIRGGYYPFVSDVEDSFTRLRNDRSLAAVALSDKLNADGLESKSYGARRILRWRQPEVQVLPPHKMSEEEMAAAAEKEEELRDRKENKERKYWKPTQINPIMTDRTKVRKYELRTSLVQMTSKPLWTSIRAINKELRQFAEKHDRVIFFDATDLFADKVGKSYTLITDRISVRGHPTERGFVVWEDEIVKKLDQILIEMKREQPELFKDLPAVNVADEKDKDKQTGSGDDYVARQRDDDVDDTILHPNDDGFGQMEEDVEGMQSSASADGDDDGAEDEDGDLLVAGGVNDSDDEEGNFRAADEDAQPDNDDEAQFRVKGDGDGNG